MSNFTISYTAKSAIAHEIAEDKGFWGKKRTNYESICRIHSKLSEALDALQDPGNPDEHIPHFTREEAEIADAVIIIMDLGHALNLRIADAIEAKMAFNETRPKLKGKGSYT